MDEELGTAIFVSGHLELGYLGTKGDGKLIMTTDPEYVFRWALEGTDAFDNQSIKDIRMVKMSVLILILLTYAINF